MKSFAALAAALFVAAVAATSDKFPALKYGYVNINAQYDSHMFYALVGDANKNSTQRGALPLVIYLQGGPGASSLFGDFLENGPQKLERSATAASGYKITDRKHSWTKHANMLYLDNPIGTGFSYTNATAGYTTTDDQIAADLVVFMTGWYKIHPEYKSSDLWVFCESYGGKMTAYFGAALQKAVAAGTVPATNYKGVAIGDGWVDPVSCMKSYGKYLQGFSQMTKDQVANVTKYAQFAQDALERGDGAKATHWWGEQQGWIGEFTAGVNWYNTLYYYDYTADMYLGKYIRDVLTPTLGSLIPSDVRFVSESDTVFEMLKGTFMRDGVHQVQEMIDAGLSVNVYGGQVDLIVDTWCIQRWIDKLEWSELGSFWKAPRKAVYPAGVSTFNVGGFVQKYKNFAFWQINQAGHMVPLDQPAMAETMLVSIIGGNMKEVDPVDSAAKTPAPEGKQGVIHMKHHSALKKFMAKP